MLHTKALCVGAAHVQPALKDFSRAAGLLHLLVLH